MVHIYTPCCKQDTYWTERFAVTLWSVLCISSYSKTFSRRIIYALFSQPVVDFWGLRPQAPTGARYLTPLEDFRPQIPNLPTSSKSPAGAHGEIRWHSPNSVTLLPASCLMQCDWALASGMLTVLVKLMDWAVNTCKTIISTNNNTVAKSIVNSYTNTAFEKCWQYQYFCDNTF